MAFPDEIVTFPTMLNITASDGALVKQFQKAMEEQNIALATSILAEITNADQKIISANYLNLLGTTLRDVEMFYAARYNPAYIVSSIQPAAQEIDDFWFEVTS